MDNENITTGKYPVLVLTALPESGTDPDLFTILWHVQGVCEGIVHGEGCIRKALMTLTAGLAAAVTQCRPGRTELNQTHTCCSLVTLL